MDSERTSTGLSQLGEAYGVLGAAADVMLELVSCRTILASLLFIDSWITETDKKKTKKMGSFFYNV